ncbi:site-specific DNA-methyltransferase [Rhizobium ruizarguesonis]
MKKLDLHDSETKSADVITQNIDALRSLFPDALQEGKIDFDVLKQLLGGAVDERDEKYGLNWHGKRKARQIALTPSSGTLLPAPDDSVDWDTTQNLMIEGDNLEVLKLLQKSYAGKVKLIYIDPPYNTGKDFVYPDDFRDSIRNYLELTGQVEGGQIITSNTESSGRFHTDWLNMMFPRLKLAKSLLAPDGAIFISCDDNEAARVRILLDEIFGEECFVSQIVWEKMYTTKNDASLISANHDYIVVAARRDSERSPIGSLPRTAEMDARYSNPDGDPRGPWKPIPLYADGERKNGRYMIVGKTGKEFLPPPNSHWRYAEGDTKALMDDNRIWFGKAGDAQPNLKRFLRELDEGVKARTIWSHKDVGSNDTASREIKNLLKVNESPFSFPKPTSLVSRIIELGASSPDAIILDFFAGSGSTAHAVMLQNAKDQGKRRYILVQLPEPIDPDSREQKAASDFCDHIRKPRNLAELTKHRLRLAASKVHENAPMFSGDLGFRVFKLAQSNIRAWEPTPTDLEGTLLVNSEHLVQGRSEQDVLYELLLKLGLDLCVPIEKKQIASKTVHAVGGGALIVCLADGLILEVVEEIANGIVAWRERLAPAVDTLVVFKDSGFADDVAKTNMAAILNQNGILDVRSL